MFGPVQTYSDAFGYVRMRSEAVEQFRICLREIVKVVSMFGSILSFREVFRTVRACSDALGYDRMHPEAFGRARSCHIPANLPQ